jgi:NAD+ synthase (glutamine-hydrolysing)
MQIVLNQTQHIIGDFEQIFQDLKLAVKRAQLISASDKKVPHLELFPELFLTGYPLQDLVLQKEFIERYTNALDNFDQWLKEQPKEQDHLCLVGGLTYQFDEDGLPLYIKNVIFACHPGSGLEALYTKCLLPNYDIFDEEKYFCPGDQAATLNFAGKTWGLLICEDMWFSSTHTIDPVKLLYDQVKADKIQLDGILNLSASPYFIGKQAKRETRAKEIAHLFQCPFYYVNRVGGEDEILFDGQSFATDGKKVIRSKPFEEDALAVELLSYAGGPAVSYNDSHIENSWESLFQADLTEKEGNNLPQLKPWDEQTCEEVIQALAFGLQEYASKCGFKNFLVALSGGIDSGLVLTLTKMALRPGQKLEAVYMPSRFSSPLSTELAEELCENLKVPLNHFPIKFLHSTMKQEFQNHYRTPLEGLADENIQSRLRGAILYARSNQTGAIVINTSNKSELAVGYSTLYGDSVGAISMLGDLYKSQVYDLSRYLYNTRKELPLAYIERPPSAELRENQEDSQSLPPYPRLDAMLEGFLSYRLTKKNLHDLGFDQSEVQKTYDLYTKSEYKRNQFCPIIKVKAKSFGFGYRMPITKKS